ncbi:NUDIX hydrolase domain-like protein [Trametes gibbosa]|nr:NUDIX hydrolase domain-like protein [Trametes gibbosa]
MPGPTPTAPQTLLQIVQSCDNFRLPASSSPSSSPSSSSSSSEEGPEQERLLPWLLTPSPTSPVIGLLRPAVVAQLRAEIARSTNGNGDDHTSTSTSTSTSTTTTTTKNNDPAWTACRGVSFARGIATPGARTRVMRELCERWRDAGLFAEEIGPRQWRGEMYAVYRRPFGVRDCPRRGLDGDGDGDGDEEDEEEGEDGLNYAFRMERAASGLFGIVTCGVHMTVYEEDEEEGEEEEGGRYKVWVPRRAGTKQTWPGYLDNSVAGGIEAGRGVFECVVKEAMEEASLPEDVVRRYARAVGSVSYFFRTPRGWLQPEIEYLYEMALPAKSGVRPQPLDGEVESFELLPLREVVELMRAGLFKYNSAIVLIDFMVRKGIITADNEREYAEIVTGLHRPFDHLRSA